MSSEWEAGYDQCMDDLYQRGHRVAVMIRRRDAKIAELEREKAELEEVCEGQLYEIRGLRGLSR